VVVGFRGICFCFCFCVCDIGLGYCEDEKG